MNSKISEKDKKTWEEFLSNDQKLPDKDNLQLKVKFKKTRFLDLHGKSLDEANKIIDLLNDAKHQFNVASRLGMIGKDRGTYYPY